MPRAYSLTLVKYFKLATSPESGTLGLWGQRRFESVYLRWDEQYGYGRRQPTAGDLINTSIVLHPYPLPKGGRQVAGELSPL